MAALTILVDGGYVKLENYFVDGTKLEANVSKYSFVWAKNTKLFKTQVQAKVAALLETIEQINAAENAAYGAGDLPERGGSKQLDVAQLAAKINELNERLRQMPQVEKPANPPTGGEPPQGANAPTSAGSAMDPIETVSSQAGEGQKKGDKREQRHKSIAQQLAEEYLPRLKKYEEQEAILEGRNSYTKRITMLTSCA